MEKTQKFQIVYAAHTNLGEIPYETGVSQPPHYPIGGKRVYTGCIRKHGTVWPEFMKGVFRAFNYSPFKS